MRERVRADGITDLDEMFFSSTHDESAPDTIGISGPDEYTSGANPFYVQFLIERAAQSIEQAYGAQRPARIRFGQVRPGRHDHVLVVVPVHRRRADRRDAGDGPARPRDRDAGELRHPRRRARLLGRRSGSPAPLLGLAALRAPGARGALRGRRDDARPASMGSVEMPQIYPTPRDLTPVALYRSQGNGGCRTIYATDDTRVPYGYELSTRARGERIASWAGRALDAGDVLAIQRVEARRETITLPLDNALFGFASVLGVIVGKVPYLDGVELMRTATGRISPPRRSQRVPHRRGLVPHRRRRVRDRSRRGVPVHLRAQLRGTRRPGGAGRRRSAGLGDGAPVAAVPLHLGNRRGHGRIHLPGDERGGRAADLGGADDVDRFGCGHSDDGEAAAVNAGDVWSRP